MATSLAPPQRRTVTAFKSRRLLALLDDDRLGREAAKGSTAAFEVIYDRHHAGILSFCRHLLGSRDEAEDAVQQTFVSAYRALNASGKPVRLKPWLYTIARNRCISTIRARRDELATQAEPSTEGLHQEVQRRADLRQLLGDLQLLPVDQRAALVLSEIRGMSHRDVAETLGCDARKVKALVFQARTHLTQLRTAHDTPCADVRREIATRRRGAPSGAVRRHIAVCTDCAHFRERIGEQRRALGLLLPVVPAAGLKVKALAAVGAAAGGSSGAAAPGGAWLACHAQVVKLTALGATALTAAAVTVPLVTGGSQPARAGSDPQVTKTHALWPVTHPSHSPKRTIAHHARRHHRSHASARVTPAVHKHAVVAATPHVKHHTDAVVAPVREAPSAGSDDRDEGKHGGRHHGHGHAYAYGHRHARGWLRHHGGG